MPFTFTMPKLSPTMEEGVITKWYKKEGDFVESGETLIEVATDKASVEHAALDEGYLRKILIAEGENAAVNQAIAVFSEKKDEDISSYEPEGLVPAASSVEKEEEEAPAAAKEKAAPKPAAGGNFSQPAFQPEPPLEHYSFEFPNEFLESKLKASPLARKLAAEQNLDLSTVKGSGPGGRVVSKDLEMAQQKGPLKFCDRTLPKEKPGTFYEEALTPMRKSIGQRLQEAKTFIPHFYVKVKVDADHLFSAREQLKELGIKATYNDFVLRACALALREHPGVNSGFNTVNNTMTFYKTIDVSVAVSVDGGLITPIIRHADYKNIGQISAEVKRLAGLAKRGKLQPHEYKGGSFTVSNLGMFGVEDFAAVINPPQSAILAVGGMLDEAVVKQGSIVPGKTMNLTLSADHRVVDGVLAAQFLNSVKKFLENPAGLLI